MSRLTSSPVGSDVARRDRRRKRVRTFETLHILRTVEAEDDRDGLTECDAR